MSKYPINNINYFSERNNFNIDNQRKKLLHSLNNNSLLLKNIIKNKEKQKNIIKKLFEIYTEKQNKENKENKENKNIKTQEKTPYKREKAENFYFSSTNIPKDEISQKENYNINSYDNKLNRHIINNDLLSYKSNLKSKINKKKDNYFKIAVTISKNNFRSPINNQKKKSIFSIDNSRDEMDRHVLSFQGQKIFATSSFSGLNNRTMYNSPKFNNTNNSELFRNYNELKLKKEEIYKRKIKKSISSEKRQILQIQRDKEIKEHTLDLIIDNNYRNKRPILYSYCRNSKYINKIHIQKKDTKGKINKKSCNVRTGNKNMNINPYITSQNSNYINSLPNNIVRIMNKYNNLSYSRDYDINFKNNNKSTNKCINKKINDISTDNYINYNNLPHTPKNYYLQKNCRNYSNIINTAGNIKVSNFIRNKRNIKSNTIDLNMNKIKNLKHKYKNLTPDRYTNPYKFIISKKKFLEDLLNNIILFSEDNKLTIRMHCFKDINQEFIFKRKKPPKLYIQKVVNIFLSSKIKLFLNCLKNKNISKMKILSSIKEEEEKSKTELMKNESQFEEQDNFNYLKNRNNKIYELKQRNFMSSRNNANGKIKKINI